MSIPRYEKYKDSAEEWLGKIPEHWGLAPLKRLASIDNSGSYGVDPDQGNEILPVATTAQIDSNGNFDVDRMPLRGFTTDEVSKYRCRSGEILVVKSSGSATNIISGKAGIVSEKTPIFVFSNFLLRIAPKKAEVVPEYMYALLVSHLTKERIKMMVSTTTYPNLQVGEYSSALLPLPPLSEQQAIVTFLNHETGKIDALVAEQEKLIGLLKEKRQAVISHAVTKGLDPNARMKDSGVEWLGEVPEGWEVKPLKQLVRMKSGGTPKKDRVDYWDGFVPWASAKDIKTEYLFDTEDHLTQLAIQEGAADLSPAPAILVVVRGMILARCFPVALTCKDMAFNQDLKAILPLECLIIEFLAWYFRGTERETLCRLDEAGHGTKALRMEKWTSLEVAFPSISEQRTIAAFLDHETGKIDALIEEAKKAIELMKERRTALISAAVTGKIDVRGYCPAEEEEGV